MNPGQRRAQRVAATAEVQAQELLERAASKPEAAGEKFDARAFRRSLNQTGRYTRKIFNDPASLTLMEEHGVGYSTTGLVAQMREAGNQWTQGEVAVKLAQAYGFCWGVERAVQMAYEARKAYPSQRLHITNEIIHNPSAWQRWRVRGRSWWRAPRLGGRVPGGGLCGRCGNGRRSGRRPTAAGAWVGGRLAAPTLPCWQGSGGGHCCQAPRPPALPPAAPAAPLLHPPTHLRVPLAHPRRREPAAEGDGRPVH